MENKQEGEDSKINEILYQINELSGIVKDLKSNIHTQEENVEKLAVKELRLQDNLPITDPRIDKVLDVIKKLLNGVRESKEVPVENKNIEEEKIQELTLTVKELSNAIIELKSEMHTKDKISDLNKKDPRIDRVFKTFKELLGSVKEQEEEIEVENNNFEKIDKLKSTVLELSSTVNELKSEIPLNIVDEKEPVNDYRVDKLLTTLKESLNGIEENKEEEIVEDDSKINEILDNIKLLSSKVDNFKEDVQEKIEIDEPEETIMENTDPRIDNLLRSVKDILNKVKTND